MDVTHFLQELASLKKLHPQNAAVQCLDPDYFASLSAELQNRLRHCINSGMENPDSQMGCYASFPADYDDFEPFFSEVIARHHGVSNQSSHVSNWNLEGEQLHLGLAGLGPHSIRVRVARNVSDLPLPPAMSRVQRLKFENRMLGVFKILIESQFFGGDYFSLTPGHEHFIDDVVYQTLVDRHFMFKRMDTDRYLRSAGIAGDWPVGRGCYLSADKSVNIWVGEEDHLRIMVLDRGVNLEKPYERVKQIIEMLAEHGGLDFAGSERFGVITSCPTNLGTGMRASLHVRLPAIFPPDSEQLSAEGVALVKTTGLSVRGVGGEHTPPGLDGTVDISPSSRFGVTEAETIKSLYRGVLRLKKLDELLANADAMTQTRDRILLTEDPVP